MFRQGNQFVRIGPHAQRCLKVNAQLRLRSPNRAEHPQSHQFPIPTRKRRGGKHRTKSMFNQRFRNDRRGFTDPADRLLAARAINGS